MVFTWVVMMSTNVGMSLGWIPAYAGMTEGGLAEMIDDGLLGMAKPKQEGTTSYQERLCHSRHW